MNKRTQLLAPFAHLLGLAASAESDEDKVKKGRRAEEDDDKEKDDDNDKDGKARRAEDDKDKDDEAKGGRAEGDDDKEKDDDKSSRRAKGEEDDEDMEDDEDEMRGNSAAAKARRRERARCAAIFGCKAAGARPDVAATLAFSTTMSRREAIAVLTSTATSAEPRRRGLDERMQSLNTPVAGVDGGASTPSGMSPVAAAIVAAGEKARGK